MTMDIEIRERDVHVSLALRAHVRRRLGFALRSFGERLGHVVVRFSDTNGERGGLDKRCQIEVGVRPFGSVRIEGVDGDPFAALDRAAQRASRSIVRKLERRRGLARAHGEARA
jgi:putative sigma-54 modulation protein